MSKFLYSIYKLNIESYKKWWLYHKKAGGSGILSEILQGFSFNLENTLNRKFKLFEIEGNSVQDGSPSPDNEVPILSAGDNGSINEKIQTKNFLPNVATSQTKNGIDFTIYDDGTVKANGTSTVYAIITIANIKLPRGNYILNGCPTGGGGSTYLLRTQDGVNISNVIDTGSGANISITEKSGSADIKLQISPNVTINNLIFKPMIRLASVTDDTYVPHEEQDYSIFVQQPMRSIGDVRDCFVKKSDGKLYERHYIGEVVLDGSRVWNKSATYSNETYFCGYLNTAVTNIIDGSFSLNNSFQIGMYSSVLDKECMSNNVQLHVRILASRLTENSVEGFKQWLSTHNVKAYGRYVTPLDLPCTEEQIQQIENKPSTYKEMTIINSQDETPAYLKIQYWKEVQS